MSIYIGNDLEDRLKILEMENTSLKKYSEYHQVVLDIDHMSDIHVDSSFHKQSMKVDKCDKIKEWIDSIGQSTVSQTLEENPELTVFITFKMNNIASGNQEFINSLKGNTNGKINAKHITSYRTYSGLGLLISKAHVGSYLAIANDGSSSIPKTYLKFLSSKLNCTDLNKWRVISVTWSNKGENLSNCWSNGEKLITFTTGNVKGSDWCKIGDLGKIPGWNKTHLAGCIGEIIGLYKTLNVRETSYIHEY